MKHTSKCTRHLAGFRHKNAPEEGHTDENVGKDSEGLGWYNEVLEYVMEIMGVVLGLHGV